MLAEMRIQTKYYSNDVFGPFLFGPVSLPAMPTRGHDYAYEVQYLAVMTDNQYSDK